MIDNDLQAILSKQADIVKRLQQGLLDTMAGTKWLEELPVVSSALSLALEDYYQLRRRDSDMKEHLSL